MRWFRLSTAHWCPLSTGDHSNALPLCPEPAISNHLEVEAAYQNVSVCPPPWPPPVSVQFQESGVAGLALQTYESPFETATRKGEFPFQLIGETYEVVTGKGEFLFQKLLESENGELVFPEVNLFSEARHQATQLPATHYSTSRSHPTAGNFAELLHCSVQGKGMYC